MNSIQVIRLLHAEAQAKGHDDVAFEQGRLFCATGAQVRYIVVLLKEIVEGDDLRHRLTEAIWGIDGGSTKGLSIRQASAWIDWLIGGEQGRWTPTENSRQAMLRVLVERCGTPPEELGFGWKQEVLL